MDSRVEGHLVVFTRGFVESRGEVEQTGLDLSDHPSEQNQPVRADKPIESLCLASSGSEAKHGKSRSELDPILGTFVRGAHDADAE